MYIFSLFHSLARRYQLVCGFSKHLVNKVLFSGAESLSLRLNKVAEIRSEIGGELGRFYSRMSTLRFSTLT